MKRSLGLLLGITCLAAVLPAAVINCSIPRQTGRGSQPIPMTMQYLLEITAAGDQCLDGDKLYSNWTYTSNLNQVPANEVEVRLFFNVNGVGQDVHYVTLTPLFGGVWFQPFSFGYNIQVYNDPQRYIDRVAFDVNAPGGGTTASKVLTIGGVPLSPIPGNSSKLVNATSIDVAVSVTPSLQDGVLSVSDNYRQSVIPEPATYALFGGGLLALGFLSRRRSQE